MEDNINNLSQSSIQIYEQSIDRFDDASFNRLNTKLFEEQGLSQYQHKVLELLLKQSRINLTQQVQQVIYQERLNSENKIVSIFAGDQQSYFKSQMDSVGNQIYNQLGKYFNDKIINSIHEKIKKGQIRYNHHKQSYNIVLNKLRNSENLLDPQMKNTIQYQSFLIKQKASNLDRILQSRTIDVKSSVHDISRYSSQKQLEGWNSQDPQKLSEINEMLKKIQEEKQKRKHLIQNELEKQRERQKSEDERKQKEEQLKREEKHKLILKEFEDLKKDLGQKKQQREEDHQRFQDFYKKWKSEKYLFTVIEENEQKKQESLLEERKRILQQKREIFKPHQVEDFREHEQKYKEFKENMKSEQKRKLMSSSIAENPLSKQQQQNYYRSKISQRVEEELEQMKNELEQDLQKKQEKESRMKNYSKIIQQNFKPKIDPKKKEELEQLIEQVDQLNHKPQIRRIIKKKKVQENVEKKTESLNQRNNTSREANSENLNFQNENNFGSELSQQNNQIEENNQNELKRKKSNSIIKKQQFLSENEQEFYEKEIVIDLNKLDKNKIGQKYMEEVNLRASKNKKPAKEIPLSQQPYNKTPQYQSKYTNYMSQVRNQLAKKKDDTNQLHILEDQDPKYKYDQLMFKANQLDQNAHRKEQIFKINQLRHNDKIKMHQEVDNYYIESIKTKIAILQDLHKDIY